MVQLSNILALGALVLGACAAPAQNVDVGTDNLAARIPSKNVGVGADNLAARGNNVDLGADNLAAHTQNVEVGTDNLAARAGALVVRCYDEAGAQSCYTSCAEHADGWDYCYGWCFIHFCNTKGNRDVSSLEAGPFTARTANNNVDLGTDNLAARENLEVDNLAARENVEVDNLAARGGCTAELAARGGCTALEIDNLAARTQNIDVGTDNLAARENVEVDNLAARNALNAIIEPLSARNTSFTDIPGPGGCGQFQGVAADVNTAMSNAAAADMASVSTRDLALVLVSARDVASADAANRDPTCQDNLKKCFTWCWCEVGCYARCLVKYCR